MSKPQLNQQLKTIQRKLGLTWKWLCTPPPTTTTTTTYHPIKTLLSALELYSRVFQKNLKSLKCKCKLVAHVSKPYKPNKKEIRNFKQIMKCPCCIMCLKYKENGLKYRILWVVRKTKISQIFCSFPLYFKHIIEHGCMVFGLKFTIFFYLVWIVHKHVPLVCIYKFIATTPSQAKQSNLYYRPQATKYWFSNASH